MVGKGKRCIGIGRKKHLRFDVNQLRSNDEKLGRDIHVQLLDQMQVRQILLRDLCDGNVVDVELLLTNQIQKEIERPFVEW